MPTVDNNITNETEAHESSDFISEFIKEDLASGR